MAGVDMGEDARAFTELAAVVAHELVAPLTVIGSAASLLAPAPGREEDPDEVAEIVATIERNVELAQLVVDALRHSDDDARWVQVSPRTTDVVELVRTTVSDLDRTILKAHPTEVRSPEELEANVDAIRVRQVLVNLLSNAAKYSPDGRAITVEVSGEPGETVSIRVRDRGHGVAPDDAERIFGKWTRADGATNGLGLGLHLSRAIARAHGGDIRLEDAREDEGAIFLVELPADTAATPA